MSSEQYSLKEYLRNLKHIGTAVNPEWYKKLRIVLDRDGLHFQDFLGLQIMEYVKIHGDGNQNYKLDLFNDPDMIACPAFFRNSTVWKKYLKSLDLKRYREFDTQLQLILKLANERWRELGR